MNSIIIVLNYDREKNIFNLNNNYSKINFHCEMEKLKKRIFVNLVNEIHFSRIFIIISNS